MNIEEFKTIKIIPLLDTLELSDISDDIYFKLDYISNSKLKYINPEQGGSPAKYFKGMDSLYSNSIVFGSAVHGLVLQPNEFSLSMNVDRPTSKAGFMADDLFIKYKERGFIRDEDIIESSKKIGYYENSLTPNRISALLEKCEEYWKGKLESKDNLFLDAKTREAVITCVNSLNSNKEIQKLLHPEGIISDPISLNEQTIIMSFRIEIPNYDPFNLTVKAKLDNFTIDLDSNSLVLNDLKTTGHLINEFSNSYETFHYARQMGLYGYLIMQYAQKEYNQNFKLSGNMLLVSTVPDYKSGVFKVKGTDFLKGFAEFKALLKLVAYYTVHKDEI